jgi:hypothetical protein
MTIRFPIELAAAADFAESAVDASAQVRADRQARVADATFELKRNGEEIRVVFGPGFVSTGEAKARRLIPGQTYH